MPKGPAAKGRARLKSERDWDRIGHVAGAQTYIMRLAGIYGLGRSALDTLRRNPGALDASKDTADMLVSRVHVDDITAALVAAATMHPGAMGTTSKKRRAATTVVNIADNQPSSRSTVFEYAEKLLRAAGFTPLAKTANSGLPIEERVTLSSRNRDRASKRVSNARMRSLLVPRLKYPTYREGLRAIAEETYGSYLPAPTAHPDT